MKSTHVRYAVQYSVGGATIQDTDYSKFWKRHKLNEKGKIRGPVYGQRQAREHIAELRKFKFDGRLIHKDTVFSIVKITTTYEVLATFKPNDRTNGHL